MTSSNDLENRLDAFYQSQRHYRAPDRVLAGTIAAIRTTKQRRVLPGVPWRISKMMNASGLAAAAVLVVVVIGLGLAFLPGGLPGLGANPTPSLTSSPDATSNPTPSPTPSAAPSAVPATPPSGNDAAVAADEGVVVDFLNAYFGGDADTALRYRGQTPESSPGTAAEIRYQELMGAAVTVGCAASETPDAIDCDIAYANDMFAAANAQPHTTTKVFRVDGDRVYVLDNDYPGDTPISDSFDGYLESIGLGEEHAQACPLEIASPYHTRPDECAAFESSHIDDWASWYTSVAWTEVQAWAGPPPRWVSEYPTGGFVAGNLNQRPRYSLDGLSWSVEPFDPALADYRDVYIAGEWALANSLASDFPEIDDNWIPGQGTVPIAWEVLLKFVDGTWQAIESGESIVSPPTRLDGFTLLRYGNPVGTQAGEGYLMTVDGVQFEYLPFPTGSTGLMSDPEFVQLPDGVGLYSEGHTMWVSDDGTTWIQLDLDFAPHASGGPGVVNFVTFDGLAIGQPWDGDFLWMTNDGQTWDRVAEPPRALGQYEKRQVHVIDDGLLLSATNSDGAARLWSSTDGREWNELDVPPGGTQGIGHRPGRVFMTAGDRLFVFGAPGTDEASFWVGVPG